MRPSEAKKMEKTLKRVALAGDIDRIDGPHSFQSFHLSPFAPCSYSLSSLSILSSPLGPHFSSNITFLIQIFLQSLRHSSIYHLAPCNTNWKVSFFLIFVTILFKSYLRAFEWAHQKSQIIHSCKTYLWMGSNRGNRKCPQSTFRRGVGQGRKGQKRASLAIETYGLDQNEFWFVLF